MLELLVRFDDSTQVRHAFLVAHALHHDRLTVAGYYSMSASVLNGLAVDLPDDANVPV